MVEQVYRNLVSSVVVLLKPEHSREVTSGPLVGLEGILAQPIKAVQTRDGRLVLTSVAEQMEVILGPARFDVRDLSTGIPGKKLLGTKMEQVLELLGGTPAAIGFNYELVCPVPTGWTSGKFLAEKFLKEGTATKEHDVYGAAITFYASRNSKRCTYRLEPFQSVESNSVYVNVNIHEDVPVPGKDAALQLKGSGMDEDFISQYGLVLDFVNAVFGR